MAYVDSEHKTILLFAQKTGTHTLRQILVDYGKRAVVNDPAVNEHPSLVNFLEDKPFIQAEINQYTVYAFYRNPIEKFLSFVAWHTKNYGIPVYPTVMDYYEEQGYFAPQVRWLKSDLTEIQLLDYANFESEVRKILPSLGIPADATIPTINASGNERKPSDCSTEEIAFLRELYKDDYEFFASKGIVFS